MTLEGTKLYIGDDMGRRRTSEFATMNKENELRSPRTPVVEEESLTPEQRARISLKFRTAKALLAHKRRRISSPLLPSFPPMVPNNLYVHNPNSVCTLERAPLKDLQINIDPLSWSRGSCLNNGKYAANSPVSCISVDSSCTSSITKESTGHSKVETPSATTSLRSEQYGFPGRSECSMISSLLDEDFDQCILEEIDILCEGSSFKELDKVVDTSEDSNRNNGTNTNSLSGNGTQTSKSNKEISSDIKKSFHGKLASLQDVQGKISQCHNQDIIVKQHEEFSSMPEAYSNYIESLNQDQLEAASTCSSTPLMVVAGPGSGKTSTMVGRVLMLIYQGLAPSNILAMTFTTAAASEMRDRIEAVAGKDIAKELTISTFHSFSLQICRSHADKLGRTSEFLIYGHGQQRRAVVEAVRLLESVNSSQDPDACKINRSSDDIKVHDFKDKSQKWQKFVTQAKASGKAPEECHQKGDEVGAAVLKNYNDILRSCNALDYHDLISCSVKLLTDYPEVFEECQASWKAIIVDEFQDTSAMQYGLLRLLASHGRITIVGDDDQSIFSFNGADVTGFDSFRKDFPNYKEVRLKKNYRSTRSIVEAAASLIQHNRKRCQLKQALTDNSAGAKITLKECRNEDAQCAFVVDKVFETVSSTENKCSFGNIAVLYRRQVTGKIFQAAFRDRKIPFNTHGVAFYRKKVIKAIMAMLKTTLPECDDGPFRQVFKTHLPYEKEEKNRVIEHIDKISTVRKCSFVFAASDIFSAKISGTFNRSQLSQGRKVLQTLEMIAKLVKREQSLSSVITSIGNLLPQKYLLEKQAIIDSDGRKLLNEDNDLRSVLEFLLDDVTVFLSSQFIPRQTGCDDMMEKQGCVNVLKAFVDYISEREKENFRSRRHDNKDSVTLTTIHQSKGLEWDVVFIVKANESEIPLLHEHNGNTKESRNIIEEERRLLYVAMTRARTKLFILYVIMDTHWQVLRPSRFLQEIPVDLLELQANINSVEKQEMPCRFEAVVSKPGGAMTKNDPPSTKTDEVSENMSDMEAWDGNYFLKRFNMDDRGIVARIFHQWAKKKAFQDPKRLLDKVRFVIDERLSCKKSNKDILVALRSSLSCDEAFLFAEKVIRWEQIPIDDRAQLKREKQEHFQKIRVENAMTTSAPTSKQIDYLHKLGCTVVPESKFHASRLIEQYKSL